MLLLYLTSTRERGYHAKCVFLYLLCQGVAELRRNPQRVEKRACRESTKSVSTLAWPPVPQRRPRHHDGHQGTQSFAPLPRDLSLEHLVPEDNFYRRLEARLDLSFVREMVAPLYAKGGRPSVDPVVFFKLQIVLFCEDLRSERQLMGVVADRLSIRWYLGYDLHQPLPDHSTLTRIRERYGLEVFRGFFERIVQMCVDAGLVWGEELFFDSTAVEANAANESVLARLPRTVASEGFYGPLSEPHGGSIGSSSSSDFRARSRCLCA